MMETSGLSQWLTSLLKPAPAPAPVPPAPAPAPVRPPVEPGLIASIASPHPNLVVLYDRARAREAALQQERAAMEPKVMAAFGVLGLLLVGGAIAMDHLAWGLVQWHSPWHIAGVALPTVAGLGLITKGAWEARLAVGELLAERKFPHAGHQMLTDPLATLDKDPDGWLTGVIQDVHATNNAHDLSLRKQQERLQHLVRLLGRLGFTVAVLAGYNAAWQARTPVTAPTAATAPINAPVAAPIAAPIEAPAAPAAARPGATPTPMAVPRVAASIAPAAAPQPVASLRAVAPVTVASPTARRTVFTRPAAQPARAQAPVAPTAIATPATRPTPVAAAPVTTGPKPPAAPAAVIKPAAPAAPARPVVKEPAAPAAPARPAAPPVSEKKPVVEDAAPAPAANP